MSPKKEYGDFQTPDYLAKRVVAIVAKLFGTPQVVIEPTAGLGAFLQASADCWGARPDYIGFEINTKYVDLARARLANRSIEIHQRDFFNEDWKHHLAQFSHRRILVIGNPPWITNSDLGQLGGKNLPEKSNFLGLRGFEARTGKSNFDIAEWMLIRLLEALPPNGAIAMLCKTMTARKVLRHFWKNDGGREGARLFIIDAKAHFDVAVDACLFYATGRRTDKLAALVFPDLDLAGTPTGFGFIDGDLVSDIDAYQAYRTFDGGSTPYTWRSGLKHDAAAVMEFTRSGEQLVNGLGESVMIEPDFVFPLLKSSDLGNGRTVARRAVLVTQTHTGDDTLPIRKTAPKTWEYLSHHREVLDGRKSSIYRNRPRFSVFGIGPYSFAPWKVAVSGLYKGISFLVVPPCGERPVMVDDTCYFIGCQSRSEAEFLCSLLSTRNARSFLESLVFTDSKRPITIDVLRRLSFVELARAHGKLNELERYVSRTRVSNEMTPQMLFLMESMSQYRTRASAHKRSGLIDGKLINGGRQNKAVNTRVKERVPSGSHARNSSAAAGTARTQPPR